MNKTFEEQIGEIETHDPFCHIDLVKVKESVKVLSCDCTRPKRIKAISSLVREKVQEVIGELEDEQRKKIEGVVTLATIPNLRNELRQEQKQRADQIFGRDVDREA